MIIKEDDIRRAISSQLKEWVADDLNRRFSRFEGTDIEDLRCDLSKIPDDLFIMVLTAFPGVFYKARRIDSEGVEKTIGLFTSMSSAEKAQFRSEVQRKYAKKDVARIKKVLSKGLDLAFPGTSFLVCSQITSLAKIFGTLFSISFDADASSLQDSPGLQQSVQLITDIIDEIGEVARNHILDNSSYGRKDTLLKFNLESFAIFPSVVEAFANDRYTDTLAQRKQDFETSVLRSSNTDMENFYLLLIDYYDDVSDQLLLSKIDRICKKIRNTTLSDSEFRAAIDDLDFRCDFAYNNLKMFL